MNITSRFRARSRILLASLAGISCAVASTEAASAGDKLRPFIERYCWECHSSDHAEGNVDLELLLAQHPLVVHGKTWRRISQLVELRSMSPEEADQPTSHHRKRFVELVSQELDQFDYSKVRHPGYEPVRRLTHREYNNTLRDLLGVDLRPADLFPRELKGETGFDNAAANLSLQTSLMERYIATAERVVDAAIPLRKDRMIDAKARKALFSGGDITTLEDSRAKEALTRFMTRAFRRPPDELDLRRLHDEYEQSRAGGLSPLAAVKEGLPSILISPNFLMRIEKTTKHQEATPITDWELACRLSYFLWSSMPDEELLQLAASNRLGESNNVRKQLQRMIQDKKVEAFFESFTGQWLSTQLVGREIRRDPIDEPWCTDTLMDAMRQETMMLFMSIVRENQPLTELLDADYTFVNEELANTLYEIEGVQGKDLRRVSLAHQDRRGILGHAGVLAVTSNYDETSPIKRGAYILENLLGTPPPPPPLEVAELDEELEEDDRLTFAQKLRRHADDRRCATCHQTIDPLGIALEDYGAFGRHRGEHGESLTRATLADGYEVSGLQGLNEYLLTQRREDLIRNLVVRTLEYALCRPVEYYDEPAIRKIIEHVKENDLRMQSLLEGVVTSYPFRYQQTERAKP
ncbi:MAG: DUF1592 domain-containing protein [Lacipirellulaceae bacterium]